jgi:hypothetical protein
MTFKPNSFSYKPKVSSIEYEWCFKVYKPEKGKYKEYYDSYLRQEERRNNMKYFGNYEPFEGKGYICNNKNEKYIKLLNENKIFSRKDWKKWLKKNHPDKKLNINNDLVAMINSTVEIIYPSKI